MSKVVLKSDVSAAPDRLWRIVRDFSAPDRWNPLVRTLHCDGDRIGGIRRVELEGTGIFVERLERRSDWERVYRYAILESPLPISHAVVEVRVTDNGDKTASVEWVGSFHSEAPSEFQAVRAFQQLYQSALDNLAACTAGAAPDSEGGPQ